MIRHRPLLVTATVVVPLLIASCTDDPAPTAVPAVTAAMPSGPSLTANLLPMSVAYGDANDSLIISNPSLTVTDGEATTVNSATVELGSQITFAGHYRFVHPGACSFPPSQACRPSALVGWIVPGDTADRRFAENYRQLTVGTARPVDSDFTWSTRAPFVPGTFKVGGAAGAALPPFSFQFWRARFGFDLDTPDLANKHYASFEITVTEPAILPSVTGTAGGGGWYRSDVNVSWVIKTVNETIQSSTGCDPTVVATDTPSETVTCSVVASNGPKSKSVTFKRDATKPVVSIKSVLPAENVKGWNNSDVVVSWDCADALSGVQATGGSKTVSAEGASQSAVATCADIAGNTDTKTQLVNIDKTAPTLAPSVPNDTVEFKSVVVGSPNAADPLSGVASQGCDPIVTTLAGKFTVNCSATDNAGNSATRSLTYVVKPAFTFGGFQSPIIGTALNSAKAGGAVPLNFSIGGDKGLDILAKGSPTSKPIACPLGATVTTITEPASTAGGSGLQYDATTGVYTYVWKTEKSWAGTCRTLTLTFLDGVAYSIDFEFKK